MCIFVTCSPRLFRCSWETYIRRAGYKGRAKRMPSIALIGGARPMAHRQQTFRGRVIWYRVIIASYFVLPYWWWWWWWWGGRGFRALGQVRVENAGASGGDVLFAQVSGSAAQSGGRGGGVWNPSGQLGAAGGPSRKLIERKSRYRMATVLGIH